ncbi:2-hydroxy-6-oxo-6-(2'-aminophenyl)hexa-2,4-dienoic acid hydrolase [mine drainage metagenome]|uniref:2-hydroxy-6-oxo-6-(2'-aminophenyl)hexa-2, 4-dienoic acid hydrolase n=1 Tax=mine drainage metagenome TaxID=410659 RepID=A0A1J5SWH9_9ZZZZ
MQKKFLYQQKEIFYRVEGKGKPVVLIHGFPEDGSIFNRQIDFLKEHCLLIVPDLPGSGLSELLDNRTQITENRMTDDGDKTVIRHPSSYISIDDYADCIKAMLEHENISSCIMLGHSMGGYITLAFAEKYQNLLSGFGLIHSTAFADNEEKKSNRQKAIDFMEEHGAFAFVKTGIPNLFSLQSKEAFPQKIASLIEKSKDVSTKACQQYYAAMMNRPDRTHVLKGNPLPVLFVIGEEDVAAPLNDLLQQIDLPESVYIHILKGVGHMSMLEAPDDLNKFLLDYISKN